MGTPATRCSTFGERRLHARALAGRKDDDVETSDTRIYYRADRAPEWAAPVAGARRGRRLERRPKRVVVAERLEVGIAAGEGAVLGIERDGTLEVRDGFGVLAPLGVRDGEHVESRDRCPGPRRGPGAGARSLRRSGRR